MLTHRNTKNFSPQQGFNLLELLVVLGLIALTLGVLVPSGQAMLEKSRLVSATNAAYSALLYTRNDATRLKTDARLCFITSKTATQCTQDASVLLGTFTVNDTDQKLEQHHEINEQISLVFKGVEDNKIEFESRGNRKPSDENKDVYLEISTEKLKRQVEVCFNGRVRIREILDKSECR
ncbi:prepilin-type N-terminal cleavage/methylation domain-containing protein [Marinospirillum minutulum]|uniref:prepilin-type N-terminal cleavage/methylation domain-containing protein n=1 Tax=Marinospirillum minutulum TaxID=64974 RepID=UPI0003FA2EF3|nr:prepilin-type N-terminal cleavage/methylation domain-containing protein [Marinospirillum minutulum]